VQVDHEFMYKLCAKIVPHNVDTAQTTEAVPVAELSKGIESHTAIYRLSDGIQIHQGAAGDDGTSSAAITQPSVIEDYMDSPSSHNDLNANGALQLFRKRYVRCSPWYEWDMGVKKDRIKWSDGTSEVGHAERVL